MEVRKEGNTLKVSATNFLEFKNLLIEAEKEAQQLHETLRKLSCFEFEFGISFETFQACGMDSASSETSIIPTK